MKIDIILAGVGGQGILSIATTIGLAALSRDLFLKQSEVHGMSQRGGDVSSHIRISDKPIASDLIPMGKADLILSVEPMEALRYLPFLSATGWLVTNTEPFQNIGNYPAIENILSEIEAIPNHLAINADEIALQVGSKRVSNIVMLGAASPHIDIPFSHLEESIEAIFRKKGQKIVDLNSKALHAGREYSISAL